MDIPTTHDASMRIADLLAEWEESRGVGAAPSIVVCEVFGIGVLQQLIRDVLGTESLLGLLQRHNNSPQRIVVCVNAVDLSSARFESSAQQPQQATQCLLSAIYSMSSGEMCSANAAARRVVYSSGSLNNNSMLPEVLWDSSGVLSDTSLLSAQLQHRMTTILCEKLQNTSGRARPSLVTISVGLLPWSSEESRRSASSTLAQDIDVQNAEGSADVRWFDIHVADGIGGSGLLPEVVSRCCSVAVAEAPQMRQHVDGNHRVGAYDASDAAALRFWFPFLDLLHPDSVDPAVLVSVASASHLIDLHHFHDVMKKFFEASNSGVKISIGGADYWPQLEPQSQQFSAVAEARKLVAFTLLSDQNLLNGGRHTTHPDVSTIAAPMLNDSNKPISSSSPLPKNPGDSDSTSGMKDNVVGESANRCADSVEMHVVETELVPVQSSQKISEAPDHLSVLPNSSTYVAIADGSSMMSPPCGKTGASVFDRLASPSPKNIARRRASNSPIPGRRPLAAGTQSKPQPTASALQSKQQPQHAQCPDAALHPQHGEAEEITATLQKRIQELQAKFDTSVIDLTREAEGKLIAKDREVTRLSEQVAQLRRQLDEGTVKPTEPPATKSFTDDDYQRLRSSLDEANVIIRRTEEDKNRLEKMLEFARRDADTKAASLEQQLKRQQNKIELKATKKLADEATQHEARFALAREALEKQVEALANENQMLKNDKKNLVASLRLLRQASSTIGGAECAATSSSSAALDVKLDEMKDHLAEVRGQLSQIQAERDALRQQEDAKSDQISTLLTTIDMLKSQLDRERTKGVDGAASTPAPMKWSSTSGQQDHSVQSVVATGGIRRPGSSGGPVAVSRVSAQQRHSAGSPMRPGVAHYLMQQRVDPSDMVSPRKAGNR